MPKLICRCGYVHDLSPIPDAGWVTVRDREYEELIALHCEAERRQQSGEAVSRPREKLFGEIVARRGRLYECPTCGRLMWKRPGGSTYAVFASEPPAI